MYSMLETMNAEKGIGIAAIQVGNPIRALIVEIKAGFPFFIINPVVNSLSLETIILQEGCLSVREEDGIGFIRNDIQRPISINISYFNLQGDRQELAIDGTKSEFHLWFSRCLMHELDHLDGRLLIDYNLILTAQEEL
jgi:peptide deformylase